MSTLVTRLRGPLFESALALAVVAVELVLVATVMPQAGSGGRGTPAAVVGAGAVDGLVTALTAAGIILVYRTIRVINFAQAAIGTAGAVLTFNLLILTPVPFWIAVPLGLLVSGAVALGFELVFVRRFFNAPRLVLTVFTIVVAELIGGSAKSAIDVLPIFPDPTDRTLQQVSGRVDMQPLLPLPGVHVQALGVSLGFRELFAIVAVALAFAALAGFLRFTRLGVAVRALAENSERASLLGISVGLLSSTVWVAAGLLSGLGSTLNGMLNTPANAFSYAPEQLLVPLAAAVLARMRGFTVALAAGVGLSALQRSLAFSQPDLAALFNGLLLVVITGGLLLQRPDRGRSERGGSTWAATEEIRPVPAEMARVGAVRGTRLALILLAAAGAAAFPFLVPVGQVFLASLIALYAVVGLSLVVLTGWTGQVSLGQFGLAAVGCVVATVLATRFGLPFWAAVPLATAAGAAAALLVGIPALRLPGLFLAVATFAFAAAVHDVLFSSLVLDRLVPHPLVQRPALPFVDFEDDRAMFYLCFGALALAIVLVTNLRRSRFGRLLIGIRENEANAASAGVGVLRMKLTAFGIAGGLAGFAGALMAYQQRGPTASLFLTEASVGLFTLSVIGGISSVFGPLLGSAVFNGIGAALQGTPELAGALLPSLAVILLYLAPGGLLAVLARARDAALRIIAQRNQLVVPSLFADIDPESLHLRLVPLAAPGGASALPTLSRRYGVRSRHDDVRPLPGLAREAIAVSAAARSAELEPVP